MKALCDCQTCAYCGSRLENPLSNGVKIILSSICCWDRQEITRSGSFFVCERCYGIKHWGKGELITGAELMSNRANVAPTKLPQKPITKRPARVRGKSEPLRYEKV